MLALIIGCAGSGKSAYAEAFIQRLAKERIYLATMEARDPESVLRIQRHREQRSGAGFDTLECGHGLDRLRLSVGTAVLLEDLSNLLANELYGRKGGGAAAVRRGLDHLLENCGHLVVVSNEVFSDGEEYTVETQRYMQELALLNRELAERADLVVEVICGLPNVLKGELS